MKELGLILLDAKVVAGKKVGMGFLRDLSERRPCSIGLKVRKETPADIDIRAEESLTGLQYNSFREGGRH